MAFSIRSARVEEKARAYAAQEGTTLTGALEKALDKVLEKPVKRDKRSFEERYAEIQKIQRDYAALGDSGLTEQDIMGWDENGLPT